MPTRSERKSISGGEAHSVVRITLRQADYSFDAKGSTDEVPGLSEFTHHDMQRSRQRRGGGLDWTCFRAGQRWGTFSEVERVGGNVRSHPINGAGSVLAESVARCVPGHTRNWLSVFCLYRGEADDAAPSGRTRFSFRPAVDPTGKDLEILAGAVEASALPDRGNHSYSHFCGLHYPGDSRLLSADSRIQ